MNVIQTMDVTPMLLARILLVPTFAHVKMDLMEMELIALVSIYFKLPNSSGHPRNILLYEVRITQPFSLNVI